MIVLFFCDVSLLLSFVLFCVWLFCCLTLCVFNSLCRVVLVFCVCFVRWFVVLRCFVCASVLIVLLLVVVVFSYVVCASVAAFCCCCCVRCCVLVLLLHVVLLVVSFSCVLMLIGVFVVCCFCFVFVY